jgi:hypothetical protein
MNYPNVCLCCVAACVTRPITNELDVYTHQHPRRPSQLDNGNSVLSQWSVPCQLQRRWVTVNPPCQQVEASFTICRCFTNNGSGMAPEVQEAIVLWLQKRRRAYNPVLNLWRAFSFPSALNHCTNKRTAKCSYLDRRNTGPNTLHGAPQWEESTGHRMRQRCTSSQI